MMSRWEVVFGLLGIQPKRLSYEQIVSQPTRVLRDLAWQLGFEINIRIAKSPLSKQRDNVSADWVRRIVSEAGGAHAVWRGGAGQSLPVPCRQSRSFFQAIYALMKTNVWPIKSPVKTAPG